MSGADIARRALEAIAVEELRIGNLTEAELRKVMGFGTRGALDASLKARCTQTDFDLEDLDRDRRDLDRVGL